MSVTHIKDLKADPENRRKHNPRNIGMVVDALQQVGASRSIVIDEDNVVLAGNGVTEAAAEAGITKVQVVEVDGETLVAVRRRGLTGEQKRALAIYDNRTAELAEWDPDQLMADVDAGLSLQPWFTTDEQNRLLGGTSKAWGTDPDSVPAARATDIQLGYLFELGANRLLCGDSTQAADVAVVMGSEKAVLCATDPPYGVDFAGAKYNPRAKQWQGIAGDKRQGADLRSWLGGAIALWLVHIERDAAFYFWTAAMSEGAAAAAVQDAGLHIQSQIIWVKNCLVLGQADYHWRHENCWYAFMKGAKHRWFGERDKTTVWEVRKDANSDYEHPMQKPVELFVIPLRHHTAEGEICFEPFAGSGAQLIAAEQLQRACRAIEISPTYVQVAIDRWEAFTGQKAVKVGEAIR